MNEFYRFELLKNRINNLEVVSSLVYTLERRFPYASFMLDKAKIELQVKLHPSDLDKFHEIESYIDSYLLGKVVQLGKRINSRLIFTRQSQRKLSGSVNCFISGGDVSGTFTLNSEITEVIELLDQLFLQFAKSFGANSLTLPSLISTNNLEKAGYLPRELHQISFLCSSNENCTNFHYEDACITPAVCLPLYSALENSELAESEIAFTMVGKAFRREGGQFSNKYPLERLWEFHVREIVFFGDAIYEQHVKEQFIVWLSSIANLLDLSCNISTATDLFFHAEYLSMLLHQLLHESKLEFRVQLEADKELAVASFNSHGEHFTQSFCIKGIGEVVKRSFCIGFGLERWALILMLAYPNPEERLNVIRSCFKNSV